MSFGFSLGDRLKAAVNNIEAHGHTLQARALGQNHDPASPTISVKSPPTATSPIVASPAVDDHPDTSPTRPGPLALANGILAENALLGLRKSFNFGGRSSSDNPRTAAPSTGTAAPGSQELKDITSPTSNSRPSSPARFLTPAAFTVGSESTSLSATPQPRSPAPTVSISLPKSPLANSQSKLPTPDPEDPATYPLPPSPDLQPIIDTTSSARYSDPLGASPLLPVGEDLPVSPIVLQAPIPDEQPPVEVQETTQQKIVEEQPVPVRTSGESARSLKENGDTPEMIPDVAKQAEAAERKYDELSERFTILLTQKHNADKVLRELTPLEGGIQDHEALEGWITMMKGKVDMITEEMKRLQDKLTLQDSRMDELRDTHRLEGASQVELIAKLRSQLGTAETNLAAKAGDLVQLAQLRTDLNKAQTQAKEEEEKRTKAISLLKTVRMKLVKVEKEKEEVEKDRAEERAQRSQAGEEVERVKADREREVNALRKGFERELASAKERYEKDLQTKKAAWELEMITTKAGHAKEISAKSTKIAGLEAIVKELTVTKNQQFEDLQARQAECESSRAELEALSNRTKELEFQLREANERAALLEDTSASRSGERGRVLGLGLPDGLQSGNASPSPSRQTSYSNMQSASEVQRLLAEAEARSEAKLSDLRYKIRSLENERNEAEEEWAAKLQERVSELEKLRRTVQEKESEYAESLRTRREKENMIEQREEEKRALEREMKALRVRIDEIRGDVTVAVEAERTAKEDMSSLQIQINTLQSQLDDAKSHSTQLRTNNKTLREEMRKLQSSVQLMERQRNPGVGYWSSAGAGAAAGAGASSSSIARSGLTSPEPLTPTGEPRRSLESTRDSSIRTGSIAAGGHGGAESPAISDKTKDKDEEEVNLEYLRNVILQFLEHKEMRPNLVRVLSVILRFTPQELRRLNAKLLT